MECPHLCLLNGTKVANSLQLKTLIQSAEFECSVCKSKKSSWLCVHCGQIGCGRYVCGHAKQHFEQIPEHSLCFDCTSFAVFCYLCDDFVINDTRSRHLHHLRNKFQSNIDPENCRQNQQNAQNSHKSNGVKKKSENQQKSNNKKMKTNQRLAKARAAGLRNLGNTCFMNAVLQSLSNIQQFSCYFKQLPSLDKHRWNGSRNSIVSAKRMSDGDVLLAEELRKTLVSLWEGSKSAISPESLFAVIWKVVPRFRGYQQQDAHEFLRYMLDRLHTELLGILPYPTKRHNTQNLYLLPTGKSTIVTAIFGGVLQNEVTCLVCGNESKKHDPFLDLSLDIPQLYSSIKNGGTEEVVKNYHLTDCLSSFTELEELAETELYNCPNCKQKQRSTKRFWIRRLPNVLCLHLKRFRWNNFFRTKLDNYIEFPVKGLDMSKYVLSNMHETRGNACGSPFYDLAAVIVHHGSGAGSGHYTSYATHEDMWHHFNDSTVTVCDEETVAQSKAYILFYIRRELNLSPFNL
ncbi:ubiquitin carboxyl-terminal hydrolase 3-like [Oppia nitens]|uniref:ubiquitin carboxyl-terminal hydrolase 3-like n=1 Tax=Oppia nitens TaxID=1686743 RepID=UPI0023DC3631|nr:ubiquitin carboxyl-terminal hydrolase 3-like [Oppia nitens]